MSLSLIGDSDPYILIAAGVVVLGVGAALTVTSITAVMLVACTRRTSGAASGALNTSRQTVTAMGVALLGSITTHADTLAHSMQASARVTAASYVLAVRDVRRLGTAAPPAPAPAAAAADPPALRCRPSQRTATLASGSSS